MRKIFVITILCLVFCSNAFTDEPAKNFALRDLEGELVRLETYLGKGPIILDFWATWCKPCVKNLKKLQKLYDEFEDQGLVVFAINEDGPRSLSKVEPFVRSLGLKFPVLLDENREVALKYQVSGFPTTIVIDKNKKVVSVVRGYRPGDEADLREKIAAKVNKENKPQ